MEELFVREIKLLYKGRKKKIGTIESPEKAFQLFKWVQKELQEYFVAVYLDNKNHVIGWSKISMGTVSEAIVHPRDVFRIAVRENAVAVILLHNHPTGDTSPSKEDIATTTRLKDAGKIIGIKVLDHIIIGEGYYSLKEGGYL